MARDLSRIERIGEAIRAARLDALVCTLPRNVLLLSGYWPVVGSAMAIAMRDGRIGVLAPNDERELAAAGWSDTLETFSAGSLDTVRSAGIAIREPLTVLARAFGLRGLRVGVDDAETFEPASYAALHLYGATLIELLQHAAPHATISSATEMLARLRAVLTPRERDHVTTACRIAERAFEIGAQCLRPGMSELEVAAEFRAPLSTTAPPGGRADGFVFCMAGANAAHAYGAYARSRETHVPANAFVLVHCNSYIDGFWTDITRTFFTGAPDDRTRAMYDAVLAARDAALAALRPGATGADIDRAARQVLAARGFGSAFKHATGHGVGFAAIDHDARPRLHPVSDDVLEPGMVFNVEPAIYLDGIGGLRHCDVVALTDTGSDVLTPFQSTVGELVIA